MNADALAAALIPWYIANRDGVERNRVALRIWAGGHGRYAQLLAKLGAEVRTYTTEIDGKRYRRYLAVVRGELYREVVDVLRDRRKLRKAARKHFDILVEAFSCYSPRLSRRDVEEAFSAQPSAERRGTSANQE